MVQNYSCDNIINTEKFSSFLPSYNRQILKCSRPESEEHDELITLDHIFCLLEGIYYPQLRNKLQQENNILYDQNKNQRFSLTRFLENGIYTDSIKMTISNIFHKIVKMSYKNISNENTLKIIESDICIFCIYIIDRLYKKLSIYELATIFNESKPFHLFSFLFDMALKLRFCEMPENIINVLGNYDYIYLECDIKFIVADKEYIENIAKFICKAQVFILSKRISFMDFPENELISIKNGIISYCHSSINMA